MSEMMGTREAAVTLMEKFPLIKIDIPRLIKSCELKDSPGIIDMNAAERVCSEADAAAKLQKEEEERQAWKDADFRHRAWEPERYFLTGEKELESVAAVKDANKDGVKIWILDPSQLAAKIIAHVPIIRVAGPNSATYAYNIAEGLWDSEGSIINRWMQSAYEGLKNTGHQFPAGYSPNRAIDDAVKEVERKAPILDKGHAFDSSYRSYVLLGRKMGVPLANGVLGYDGSNPSIEEFSPFWLFTIKSDYPYNPAADTKKAEQILKQWIDEEIIFPDGKRYPKLTQIAAQVIAQQYTRTPLKKSNYGYGPGNCGKSTFGDGTAMMFGKIVASRTKIHNFAKDFGKEAMARAWFNFGDETHAANGVDMDEFKDVYGSTEMEVNAKNKKAEVKTMLAVGYHAGNGMMKANKETRRDRAYLRRWNIFHFETEFPMDAGWQARNFTEGFFVGYMKLAVEMAGEIIARGSLPFNMTEEEVLAEFAINDAVTARILNEYTEKPPKEFKTPEEARDLGWYIPSQEMKDLFSKVRSDPNTPVKYTIGKEAAEPSSIPATFPAVATAMNNIGIQKKKMRIVADDDTKSKPAWLYYNIRLNEKGKSYLAGKM